MVKTNCLVRSKNIQEPTSQYWPVTGATKQMPSHLPQRQQHGLLSRLISGDVAKCSVQQFNYIWEKLFFEEKDNPVIYLIKLKFFFAKKNASNKTGL